MPTPIKNAQSTLKNVQQIAQRAQSFEKTIQNIVKTDPWVPISLGDQKFKFELSFKAAQTIYRETGIDINSGALTNEDLGNTKTLFAILKAGFETHHPELTDDALAAAFKMKHRVYYAHAIGKALEATQPDYAELEAIVAELQENVPEELEAGPTDRPLPEITDSPFSGVRASTQD